MRWLTVAISFLFVWPAPARELVVTTWNLQWFPSGSSVRTSEDKETERIRQAGAVLKSIDADIVLLQEVRDFATCHRLAKEVGSLKVAICSQFTEFGGKIGWQQIAILSKQDPVSVWSEKWKTFGTVDPPRGFAFAQFKFGTNELAVYSLHLKSNLSRNSDEREVQLNILKRELAVEQIVHHLRDTEMALGETFGAVVVGGDLNTNRDQFPSESTLQNLEQAGFRCGYEGLPTKDRVTHPGGRKYPDATFDYIYAKGMASASSPSIVTVSCSDHWPVTRTLLYK